LVFEGQYTFTRIILNPNLVGCSCILMGEWTWCMTYLYWINGDDGTIFRVGVVPESCISL